MSSHLFGTPGRNIIFLALWREVLSKTGKIEF